MHSGRPLRRQIHGVVDPLLRLSGLGNQFQISNALTDGEVELVSIDYASERLARLLPLLREAKQIIVLSEKHSP